MQSKLATILDRVPVIVEVDEPRDRATGCVWLLGQPRPIQTFQFNMSIIDVASNLSSRAVMEVLYLVSLIYVVRKRWPVFQLISKSCLNCLADVTPPPSATTSVATVCRP